MKFTWEPSDIKGGVRFVRPTELHTDRVGQIGWLAGESLPGERGGHPLVIVDHCDGMVGKAQTKEDIAALLTKTNAIPFDLVEAIRRQKT